MPRKLIYIDDSLILPLAASTSCCVWRVHQPWWTLQRARRSAWPRVQPLEPPISPRPRAAAFGESTYGPASAGGFGVDWRLGARRRSASRRCSNWRLSAGFTRCGTTQNASRAGSHDTARSGEEAASRCAHRVDGTIGLTRTVRYVRETPDSCPPAAVPAATRSRRHCCPASPRRSRWCHQHSVPC